MQRLYVAKTECRLEEMSAYRRLTMQCLYVAGNLTECLLRKSVRL